MSVKKKDGMGRASFIHSLFIHLFMPEVFIEHLLWAKYLANAGTSQDRGP